jgi:hypothetical protein
MTPGDRVQWHHGGRVRRGTVAVACGRLGSLDVRVCVTADDGEHKHIGTTSLERIYRAKEAAKCWRTF